jgi:hypothetical protein
MAVKTKGIAVKKLKPRMKTYQPHLASINRQRRLAEPMEISNAAG